jgi:hypothetical protein
MVLSPTDYQFAMNQIHNYSIYMSGTMYAY